MIFIFRNKIRLYLYLLGIYVLLLMPNSISTKYSILLGNRQIRLNILILLLILFIDKFQEFNKIKLLRIDELFYSFFLIFAIISALINTLFMQDNLAIFSVIDGIIVLLVPFIYYIKIINIVNKNLVEDYFYGIVILGILISIQVFFNSYFAKIMIWEVQFDRAVTTVGAATTTALVLYSIFTISIYQMLKTNKFFFKISSFILILAILFTETRSAIILMFLLLTSYFFNFDFLIKKKLWKFTLFLILILILVYFINPRILNSIFDRFFTNKSISSNELRVLYAKNALLEIKKHLIIGTGVGLGIIRYNDVNVLASQLINPHNQHLSFLLEMGIIGYVLFILFVTTTIIKAKKKYISGKNIILRAFVLLVFLGFMFETVLNIDMRSSMSFWILITSLAIQQKVFMKHKI